METVDILSIVRAPIPRAISEYFYNLEYEIPNFHARLARNEIDVRELVSFFVEKHQDIAPLAFFKQQILELFGLDVYATPFAQERGYQIYRQENIRLLVLRLEDLDRTVVPAMREFLGFENFALIKRNVGEKRVYGELYKEFLAQLRLPPARVAEWHSTPYARHFLYAGRIGKKCGTMDLTPLRLATPADHDAVVALVNSAYEKYIPRIGRKPMPMTVDYADLIARQEVYVLENAGAFDGILVLEHEGDGILLENIAVAPHAQGRGVGKQLLQWLDAFTRAQGLDHIVLYTHEKMVENISIYTHMGYVETERRQENGFKRVFMRKDLVPV